MMFLCIFLFIIALQFGRQKTQPNTKLPKHKYYLKRCTCVYQLRKANLIILYLIYTLMLRNYLGLKAMYEPYSAPWCLLASAVHSYKLFSIFYTFLRCASLKNNEQLFPVQEERNMFAK